MKERPILFNGEMVRAILEGRKTQTRRPTKNPFGEPGDRLWVRETFQPIWDDYFKPGDWDTGEGYNVNYVATGGRVEWEDLTGYKGTTDAAMPSIHMPRWASRINLEVIRAWREEIQDISFDDFLAEGKNLPLDGKPADAAYKRVMSESWDKIYASRGLGWKDNPVVRCCEFKLLSVKK